MDIRDDLGGGCHHRGPQRREEEAQSQRRSCDKRRRGWSDGHTSEMEGGAASRGVRVLQQLEGLPGGASGERTCLPVQM